MEYESYSNDYDALKAFSQSLKPSPRKDFRETLRQSVCCFECECLYLHALYIPVESCGRGHLASLTAGSCFCIHMGIQGKFPAGVSCVVLWSFIVHTIQRCTEFHMRMVFGLVGTKPSYQPVQYICGLCDRFSAPQSTLFSFLREIPQEAPLRPFYGS